MFLVLCLSLLATCITGFQIYQTYIPNGAAVRHPCLIGHYWNGVGHLNETGSGVLNPFGQDFAAAGHVWNDVLCRKDSDNDGFTNGQELGDPRCHFTVDRPGNLEFSTGHPGICEPVGSPACAWQAFRC